MCDMFATYASKKYITCLELNDLFPAILSVMHVDYAIEDCKYFFTIVDMPFVGRVRPVQSGRYAVHIGNIDGIPCAIANKFFTTNDSHAVPAYALLCALIIPKGCHLATSLKDDDKSFSDIIFLCDML
jgi:hypothetical protein